jgi:endonuclease-3
MPESKIRKIIGLLAGAYGRPVYKKDDPVAVLVRTILSQNTSDTNSLSAYASLVSSFPGWQAISEATNDDISIAIKHGGLSAVKAGYIKNALREIRNRNGSFRLDFLKKLSLDEGRDWLLQLPGVGIKTANCVLLFGLDMPALPVDTHVYRVSQRLGLIDGKTPIDKAHLVLEKIVPPEDVYVFHILFIQHGRRTCRARNPKCGICVLQKICPYYQTLKSGK